jgi:hypothetical protein
MRQNEAEAAFGDKGPAPDTRDLTEALALADRIKDKGAAIKAGVLAGDEKKERAALKALFTELAVKEKARLDGFLRADKFYDGDYFALGLLKAKRIKKHPALTDDFWKVIVSRTQLRNDVQADGWEIKDMVTKSLGDFFSKETVDIGEWRLRRQKTKDTLMPSAVCDQMSESCDTIRLGSIGAGIPANAKTAGGVAPLFYLTGANRKAIRRGMHFFYTGYGDAAAGEQDYLTDSVATDGAAFYVSRPDDKDKTSPRETTAAGSISTASLDDLLDPDSNINKAAKAHKPPQLPVVAKAGFTGIARVSAKELMNGASGNAFVRAEITEMADFDEVPGTPPAPSTFKPNGKKVKVPRLKVIKFTHQEVVVDAKTNAAGATKVCLMSTAAADADGDSGIRVYNLVDASKALNVFIGFVHTTAKEDKELLDACFLNPDVLKKT